LLDDLQMRIVARMKEIDAAMAQVAQQAPQENESDRITPPWPEPWPEEVRLSDVLDEVYAAIRRHVVLTHESADAVTLWTIWTHSLDRSPTGPAGDVAPILCVTSPTRRCGKTSLLSVLLHLCPGAVPASNISPATVYRLIEKERPVLVADECDMFAKDNPELVGIINSGHRRELAYVARCVTDDHIPAKFSTWCPKVLALIGKPSATILDRSIVIRLQRKRPDESTERLNNQAVERLKTIARKLAKAVTDDVRAAMYRSDPALPAILNDRQADNWRNLFSLSDLAGGHWPTEARNAATTLALLDSDEPETLALQLVIDAVSVFRDSKSDRLKPEELADKLAKLPDRPWGTLNRGRAISPNKLAAMLRPYGIQSVKKHGLRVYLRDDFQEVCDRYCPRPPETNCPSVPLEHKCLSDNDLRGDTLKKESDVSKRSVPPQVLDTQGLTASGDTWTVENGSVDDDEQVEWVF